MVDGGDFAWKSATIPDQRLAQQRRKGQLQLDAFALIGIDGMVPGDGDLALGLDWLTGEVTRTRAPMLAANLTCGGQAPFPSSRRVEKGGVTLGIIGVLGEGLRVPEGCAVSPAQEAVRDAVAELGAVDLVLLLSHQDVAADTTLLKAIPAVDLVVSGATGAALSEPKPMPGDALLLASGSRGKKLGLAQVTLVDGASGFAAQARRDELASKRKRTLRKKTSAETQLTEARDAGEDRSIERAEKRIAYYDQELAQLDAELASLETAAPRARHMLSHELVGLTVGVADHPETAALLEEAKEEIEGTRATVAPAPAAATGPFVGSQVCAGCHPAAAAQWSTTPHAQAWTTLVREKRTQDLDCVSCHVTGAFHESGPQSGAAVPAALRGVGCESCHGPGKAHVANPGLVDMVADPGEAVCTQCHDGVQDEGRFDYATYRPHVVHGAAPKGETP